VERNPLLEQMSVMGNKWLQDDQVTAIATSCPLLRELRAQNGPSALTEAAVVALALGCP
jgi:hypothetical protein